MRASQLAQASERGWFSNTSFTTGLKTLPTFRPDALVFFRASLLENQPLSEGEIGLENDYQIP